jgi:hypothetical protein
MEEKKPIEFRFDIDLGDYIYKCVVIIEDKKYSGWRSNISVYNKNTGRELEQHIEKQVYIKGFLNAFFNEIPKEYRKIVIEGIKYEISRDINDGISRMINTYHFHIIAILKNMPTFPQIYNNYFGSDVDFDKLDDEDLFTLKGEQQLPKEIGYIIEEYAAYKQLDKIIDNFRDYAEELAEKYIK